MGGRGHCNDGCVVMLGLVQNLCLVDIGIGKLRDAGKVHANWIRRGLGLAEPQGFWNEY